MSGMGTTPRTYPPQGVWARMVARPRFTLDDLADETTAITTLQAWVASWERDGHLERVDTRRNGRIVYTCRTRAAKAPPISDKPTKVREVRQTAAGNMWTTARHLASFDAIDLAAHATTPDVMVHLAEAKLFAQMLFRGGYVRVVRKAGGGRLARYRLVRNTGPHAPVERRIRAIYDPNRSEYAHIPEARP